MHGPTPNIRLEHKQTSEGFLRTKFKESYTQKLCSQLNEGKETEGVDLKLSVIRPLGAKWIVAAHDLIKNNSDLVKNGFQKLEFQVVLICINKLINVI